MSDLNRLETTLLDEQKSRQPVKTPHRGVAVGIAGGVAALAIAGIVGASALTPVPAFAVEQSDGGDITIILNSLTDAKGLQTELAKRGLHAKVTYGATPAPQAGTDVPSAMIPSAVPGTGAGISSVTVQANSNGTVVMLTPKQEAKARTEFLKNCRVDASKGPKVHVESHKAVIDIPKGSVPTGRNLAINTNDSGNTGFRSLTATWTGTIGDYCGLASTSTAPTDK